MTRRGLTLGALRAIVWIVAGIASAPLELRGQAPPSPTFPIVLSSGPFGIPAKARSLDWVVVNDSPVRQLVRVTIWRLDLSGPKTAAIPGAITFDVEPGASFHNANGIGNEGPYFPGNYYEVTVEIFDRRVLPAIQIWSDDRGTIIPGTSIGAAGFVRIVPNDGSDGSR